MSRACSVGSWGQQEGFCLLQKEKRFLGKNQTKTKKKNSPKTKPTKRIKLSKSADGAERDELVSVKVRYQLLLCLPGWEHSSFPYSAPPQAPGEMLSREQGGQNALLRHFYTQGKCCFPTPSPDLSLAFCLKPLVCFPEEVVVKKKSSS